MTFKFQKLGVLGPKLVWMRGIQNFAGTIPFIIFFYSFFTSILQSTNASKCVVSKWREWSECQGNCEFAQRVRNRDVLRPPFPERDERFGEFFIRECPTLYEVEQCTPRSCADESPFAKFPFSASILKRLPNLASSSAGVSEEWTAEARIKSTKNETRRTEPKTKKQIEQKNVPSRNKIAGIGIHNDDESGQIRETKIRKEDTMVATRLNCSHQNQSCCRIVRASCPTDGVKSRQLIRWYRKKDEQFCRPYKYAYCGDDFVEHVFATENECLDACFTEVEKAVLPNFRVI